jgi:hypothetical protein
MIKSIGQRVFKFLSSVQLAIPSMLVLILVIAFGTVVESRYNAEYAKLLVYQSRWFNALLIMIWINVLFAALSRWPWKPRHAGFLITHLGLLLLFGGGFLTNVFGVDGSLRIEQGSEGNQVVLPDLVIGARANRESNPIFYPLRRSLSAESESFFSDINEKLQGVAVLKSYQPFVDVKEVSKGGDSGKGPLEIQFRIKSAFFDVEQSLNSVDKPILHMGPASFRLERKSLAKAGPPPREPQSEPKKSKVSVSVGGSKLTLQINGKEKSLPVNAQVAGKTMELEGYKVLVKKWVPHAAVVNNTLQENPNGSENPAMEVEIQHGSEKVRDVLYARFPTFSLRQGKMAEVTLKLDISGGSVPNESSGAQSAVAVSESLPAGHPAVGGGSLAGNNSPGPGVAGPMAGGGASSPNGNTVIFGYQETDPSSVQVKLVKGGKQVLEQNLKEGDTFTTPWMGMQLTLKKMLWNAQKDIEVIPTSPQEKMDSLPPAAILMNRYNGAPAEESWLLEGEEKSLAFDGKEYFIYFGKRIMSLPFSLKLKQFKKVDYPGTSMAKEYESEVEATGILTPIRISMNEPLNYQGYTVYQASFEQLPSGQYASIFSVNYDPGRWVKYLGGIILGIGIITFTVTRSRRFQNWRSAVK